MSWPIRLSLFILMVLLGSISDISISNAETESEFALSGASGFAPGQVLLRWTAPGDDAYTGRAHGYDIRYQPYSRGPLDTEAEWRVATALPGEPLPSMAGTRDSLLAGGLPYGASFYFCIKAYDSDGNYSALSNTALLTVGDTISCTFLPGNANADPATNLQDVSFLISFLYKGGLPPYPFAAGDADATGVINISDVSFLIKFLYKEGPPPECIP